MKSSKTVRKLLAFSLAAASGLALAGQANAAAFMNGGFEQGPFTAPGTFVTLGTGDTSITGWKVVSGTVDYVGTYWQAAEGTHSVDLSGTGPGAIEQTFDTVAGKQYTFNYFVGGNPDGDPFFKPLTVAAYDGSTLIANASQSGVRVGTRANMIYQPGSFTFVASGSSSTLRFSSNTGTAYGPVLDAVSLAVPEPSSWAMMIGGVGLIGGAMRRRQKVNTTIRYA